MQCDQETQAETRDAERTMKVRAKSAGEESANSMIQRRTRWQGTKAQEKPDEQQERTRKEMQRQKISGEAPIYTIVY
jgi:hypothetical protein